MSRKCKRCGKVATGTEEELKKIFLTTNVCRKCHSDYVNTKKKTENVTLECDDLIEILNEQGYPWSKKGFDDFLKDSYDDAEFKRAKLTGEINKFYKHDKVKEVLRGEYKICSKCRNIFPFSRFYKQKTCADGLRSNCISCHAKLSEISRQKHRERDRQYKREWYYRNRESVNKKVREYVKANPHVNRKSDKRYKLRKSLSRLGYNNLTQEQVNKLCDFKEEFNIWYVKDLVERFGEAVCLKKI